MQSHIVRFIPIMLPEQNKSLSQTAPNMLLREVDYACVAVTEVTCQLMYEEAVDLYVLSRSISTTERGIVPATDGSKAHALDT